MELNETSTIEKGKATFEKDDKSLLVKFVLMRAEVESNGKTYPKDILAKAVADLKARISKKKAAYAANTHLPDMGVDDVAAVLEDVEMEGTTVYATARVLDTVKGRNAKAILQHGAIGVSAKGNGSWDEKGRVKPGLRLDGFDFCLDPSFNTFANKSNILVHCTIGEDDENAQAINEAKGYPTLEELDRQAPIEEEIRLQKRYNFALAAGYKGTLEQYLQSVHSISKEQ